MKNTVDQELIKDTYCKLSLFNEFKSYIDTHSGCIDTRDFETVVTNKFKGSVSKNKWILWDYIKHVDLKKYKTLF